MHLITPQTSKEGKIVHQVLIAEDVYYPGDSNPEEFYVSVLLNIYQTYPDLTDSIKRRIIFAISYFCNSDDDIPDIVPEIGYLDDVVVARWVIESIGKELPEVSLA